jgi:hypothetical protein
MTFSASKFDFKKAINYVDWKLLLFLLLFLNVKLAVKIPAIVIIYLLQFNFRFGFSFKNSRLPLFYLLIGTIAFIGLVVNKNFESTNYLLLFVTGIAFWGLCLLAVHQVKLAIENNAVETIHRTIVVFFVINAVLSLCNIGLIMIETGTINPYTFQGEYQKYFIGTGDYIRGLTFDTSTTNAILNAFAVIYFLDKKKAGMVLVCMAVLLLTGSNFTNVILMLVLALLFIFKSTRDQKSLIAICLMFLIVFMAKISPQNNKYVFGGITNILHSSAQRSPIPTRAADGNIITGTEAIKRKFAQDYIDSINAVLSQKQAVKIAPLDSIGALPNYHGRILIVGPNINKPPYLIQRDTTFEERRLLAFIDAHKSSLPISGQTVFKPGIPGEITGLLQTVNFLQNHPAKIITGDGIGNFSSKLAFRATGLGFEGEYPTKFIYICKDFLTNHLDIYLNFFSKGDGLHSLTNSPFSVYDQMLSEYGLLGIVVFIVFYLGFFVKHFKKLTYGIPLLLLMMAAFSIDYWFEQLSVIVIFELMLMLNIKETVHLKPASYGH